LSALRALTYHAVRMSSQNFGSEHGGPAPVSARSLTRAVLLYLACIPPLLLLPVAIWAFHWPFVSNSAGPEYAVMELFGFCVTLAVVLVALYRLARIKHERLEDLIPLCSFLLLGTYFAAHTTEFLPPSAGWQLYVHAAQEALRGGNPYTVDGFIYPPFAVQTLAGVYRLVAAGSSVVPRPADPDYLWKAVYYLYQATQFFLVLGACGLSYVFGRRCGIPRDKCALLIIVLFVFNNPLLRTFRNHEPNLYLLDALLLALLATSTSPLLGGVAIGITSHIKLYPLLLLVPAVILREWRFITWTVITLAAILLLQTHWGADLHLYRDYIAFAPSFPTGSAFRDNSIHSVVFNTARALTGFREMGAGLGIAATVIWVALTAGIAVYFGVRFVRRAHLAKIPSLRPVRADDIRFAYMADAIAALVLLSPIVWEHHYTLLIPVAIWAIATAGRAHPWAVGVGTFLMFCVPTIDVYPFGYHRLAGLAILLWCTWPTPVRASSPLTSNEADTSRTAPRPT
jgi:hypothetical protein